MYFKREKKYLVTEKKIQTLYLACCQKCGSLQIYSSELQDRTDIPRGTPGPGHLSSVW